MLTTRRRCPQCGTGLRRGRRPGLCLRCEQVGPDPREQLPADFYDRAPVAAMLRAYDFGVFFRTVRELTGWSQQTLGGLIGLEQSQVSAVERGASMLRDIADVADLAQVLGIPGELLNFPAVRATVGQQADTGTRVVSWVDRRDFGGHIAGMVLGIAGATGLDIDRLLALLPQDEPTGARRVGAADVEVLEQLTAGFVRQDYAHGSGLIRDAAMAQLRTALPLLGAQVSDELLPRLQLAVGRLAMQAGWMSFQVLDDEAARRLWMIGLNVAQHSTHPLSTDLTMFMLANLAKQALYLGRPDESLHLARVGRTAAVGRYPVYPSTTSLLATTHARACAAQGDAAGCDRALGEAEELLAALDPANRPPWLGVLDEAELAAYQGAAHYRTALSGRDPRAAGRAVPLLRHAVDHIAAGYTRIRAETIPDLAGSHAIAGDADTAVTLGHQAIDAITGLSSPRSYDHLRTLHTALAPLHTSPGVADLRHRLAATAA